MYRCVAYTESMKEQWDRFAWSEGTVFHTLAFRSILLDSFGYKCAYHAVMDEHDQIQAMIPLVVGRNLSLKKAAVSLPFVNYTDICARSEDAHTYAIDSVQKLREQLGLSYIELRLKNRDADRKGWTQNRIHHTFVLPLLEDEENVLALSTGSNRNHVRKVYKNDWFDVSFDIANLEAFYKVYIRRMKQLGSPAPDLRFFRAFFEALPNHSHLLTVLDKQTGDVAGGMLLLTSPGNSTLYYPYGANLSEYNSKYLNNFMYWEAVRFGIRNGLKQLDLGRSQTGSGTYRYKEQWGAKPEQLHYAVYAGGSESSGPPDRESLGLFVELWKKMPGWMTDYAGKKLIKYILP